MAPIAKSGRLLAQLAAALLAARPVWVFARVHCDPRIG